jgi:hypothetical protein
MVGCMNLKINLDLNPTLCSFFSDIKSENFKKKAEKNDTKSVFFHAKIDRPIVRKITDIVTSNTKSGCQKLGML